MSEPQLGSDYSVGGKNHGRVGKKKKKKKSQLGSQAVLTGRAIDPEPQRAMRDNQTSAARTPAEPGLERARGGRKHKARRQGQAKKKRSGPLNLELVASESSSERRPGQTDAQPQPWASKGELTPVCCHRPQ